MPPVTTRTQAPKHAFSARTAVLPATITALVPLVILPTTEFLTLQPSLATALQLTITILSLLQSVPHATTLVLAVVQPPLHVLRVSIPLSGLFQGQHVLVTLDTTIFPIRLSANHAITSV